MDLTWTKSILPSSLAPHSQKTSTFQVLRDEPERVCWAIASKKGSSYYLLGAQRAFYGGRQHFCNHATGLLSGSADFKWEPEPGNRTLTATGTFSPALGPRSGHSVLGDYKNRYRVFSSEPHPLPVVYCDHCRLPLSSSGEGLFPSSRLLSSGAKPHRRITLRVSPTSSTEEVETGRGGAPST